MPLGVVDGVGERPRPVAAVAPVSAASASRRATHASRRDRRPASDVSAGRRAARGRTPPRGRGACRPQPPRRAPSRRTRSGARASREPRAPGASTASDGVPTSSQRRTAVSGRHRANQRLRLLTCAAEVGVPRVDVAENVARTAPSAAGDRRARGPARGGARTGTTCRARASARRCAALQWITSTRSSSSRQNVRPAESENPLRRRSGARSRRTAAVATTLPLLPAPGRRVAGRRAASRAGSARRGRGSPASARRRSRRSA